MANKIIYLVVALSAWYYIKHYCVQNKSPSSFTSFSNDFLGGLFGEVGYVLPSKYDHLHRHKFETELQTEKCIKFHDSEIVSVNLSGIAGRWDTHLINLKSPVTYHYALAEYLKEEELVKFNYLPLDFYSNKTSQNDSNIMKGMIHSVGLDFYINEAMFGIKYDSYFFKYTCGKFFGLISGTLHLQLRPEMSAQLETNSNLFSQIIDSIPEKSLIKIRKLIENFVHQNDQRFENFGKLYIKSLNQRIDNFLNVNELSDKTDEQVFDFLTEKCHNFSEESDSHIRDLSLKVIPQNWRLDYSNYNNPKIPFDRMLIKKRSENSFAVKLYNREKHLANSDYYYDPKHEVFWSYTEGRRSREEYLVANNDYRITYTCDERVINGKLEINEILRFYSSENTTKSGDWDSYIELLGKSLKPKSLEKLLNFGQYISPFGSGVLDKSVKLSVNPKDHLKHNEL